MKKLHSFTNLVLSMLLLASGLLAACAPATAPVALAEYTKVPYATMLQWRQYYIETYPIETKASASFKELWAFKDNALSQLKDMKFLSENCYANVRKVLDEATIGMYDTTDKAGVLDNTKLVSALVTNNLYAANADKCSTMLDETLQEVVKTRTKTFEMTKDFLEILRTLKNKYDGTPENALFRRLMNSYGSEFLGYMNEKLAEQGVTPFPTDFVGFPTSGVEAQTSSLEWCSYYQGIAAGTTPPGTPGMAPSMYVANLIGPAGKQQCTLQRQAAYEFMSRSFLTAATNNALSCGTDGGSLSSSVDENCNEVQNSPLVPTAVPTSAPR